jgi:UMF1 family MFS transporter
MAREDGRRREIFGWTMYDWASSAFSTTVVTVLAGPYLTGLAQSAVGENGIVLSLGPFGAVTAKSLFPQSIAVSVFLQVFLLPILGVVADYTDLKKQLMAVFCYVGATATSLLVLVTQGRHLLGSLLLIVANLSFGAALVLYNSFLNDITTEAKRDRISSRGFALGYLGGGVLVAGTLALVQQAPQLGLSTEMAVRLSLLSAGIWWGGFALITFRRLRQRPPARSRPADVSLPAIAITGLAETWTELRHLPLTLRYLVSYAAFNDGIQTVIAIASVFLAQELFVSKGLPPDQSFLIGLILMVQFVAFGGALLFARIAAIVGTKTAILASLVVWTSVVIYAYGFLTTPAQAWAMGAVIAVVLGGSQALSRSLFSQMIPKSREASFFGLYEISERGTSWIGPMLFGIVVAATNSYRQAMLSLIVLFIVGILVLRFTDTNRAIREAGGRVPEATS